MFKATCTIQVPSRGMRGKESLCRGTIYPDPSQMSWTGEPYPPCLFLLSGNRGSLDSQLRGDISLPDS